MFLHTQADTLLLDIFCMVLDHCLNKYEVSIKLYKILCDIKLITWEWCWKHTYTIIFWRSSRTWSDMICRARYTFSSTRFILISVLRAQSTNWCHLSQNLSFNFSYNFNSNLMFSFKTINYEWNMLNNIKFIILKKMTYCTKMC